MEKPLNSLGGVLDHLDLPVIRFSYDPEKGLAMLQYILDQLGGRYNYMALLKLAFFADRYHVRNYARPVSNDEYYALKLGPVPSNLKDIVDVQGLPIEHFDLKDFAVTLKHRKIDNDQFSQSDIEAMQFAISTFSEIGHKNPFDLANLTHAYPEWCKFENVLKQATVKRQEMDYADFVINANPQRHEFSCLRVNDPFPALSKSDQDEIFEEMRERSLLFPCA